MYDQVPPTSGEAHHLTTATSRALELALGRPQGTDNRDLQAVMRELCAAARQRGVRAEELIVLFKKTWAERPELQRMSREETGRLFDAVVTLCVEEYYRGR